MKNTYLTLRVVIAIAFFCLPVYSKATSFKFRIKNEGKSKVAVFYRMMEPSGSLQVKAIFSLDPGEIRERDVTLKKGDTVSFYGQDTEDQLSVPIKRDYETLQKNKKEVTDIPIIVPEKVNTSFESLEGLSIKLEHNKVLNFLLKMDSTSMSSLSMLEKNFQNVYPLGTFIFVDVKTNRLLLPPLEPSFWNNSENYLTVQDSLSAMVDKDKRGMANAQVAFFVAKMFDSLRVNSTAELEFKARLSLVRWKPTPQANIYQIFNDRSFIDFLQNCYTQIDNPDKEYQRYRLYFLSSYERIDDLEVYGRQFYNFGNETDVSFNAPTQVLSTNLGVMYAKTRTLSNYYSVQGAVLRTKAYDFTSLLFNGFQSNIKKNIIAEDKALQSRISADIFNEYKSLVAYNPDPQQLTLQTVDAKDAIASLLPIRTTVNDLSPYALLPQDTSKLATAYANNLRINSFNNKARFFNSHLQQLNKLFKELDQTDADLDKITAAAPEKSFSSSVNSPGLLNEIEVNSDIVKKE
ncbi:hypothetical protein MUY27_01255 [Mucilaginibacter sp. RS28]|uniref:Uncharacterized protein n=1 Tax=Mucilaginibacter straminoryzae TaxID=2932774 RepID=A0A9X1X1I9_9SPHI|nr:hypothetical protein [Mucilaginibacter straminoryzae]MCJ8208315.1 hypothetical protein [Mucilaginibacter straminoryzae]